MLLPRKMSSWKLFILLITALRPKPVATRLLKVQGGMGSLQHTSARGSQRREDRGDAPAKLVLHNTHAAKGRVVIAAELVAEKTHEKGGLQSGGATDSHALLLDGVWGAMWRSG